MRQELERIPRILLVRLRSLGDSILTLPLIEALHGWRPELELDLLIEATYAPVFLHPAVHEVLALKSPRWPAASGWTRFRAFFEIRKRRYPAVLNLHGGTTSMLFTWISGARLRIGQEMHRGSWIYTDRIPPSSKIWNRQPLHTVEHQLSIMRWLKIPLPAVPAGFLYVEDMARDHIRDRLASLGISEYFLIQPSATLETKQWSGANFAQLGDWLYEHHGLRVIYAAAPHEIKLLLEIQNHARKLHIYWSDLPLSHLIALIDGCRLFIGNDSGPTHAASALRKPVVVVWGSSNFQAWHPWGTEYEAVCPDFPCRPCPGYTCLAYGEPRCILDITVDQVAEACERMLHRAG